MRTWCGAIGIALLMHGSPALSQEPAAVEATNLADEADPAAAEPAAAPSANAEPWHVGLFPPATVYIEPLLLAPEEEELVEDAAERVAELFELRVIVRELDAPWPDLVNVDGEPYDAGDALAFPTVVEGLQYTWRRVPGLPDALAVIAVSGAPIVYPTAEGEPVESATWSLRSQGIATVTLPDLLPDVEGRAPLALIHARLERALARMLGQALGLASNPQPTSVMYRPKTAGGLTDVPWALTQTEQADLRIVRGLCAVADERVDLGAIERALADRQVKDNRDAAAAALAALLLERRDSPDAPTAIDHALALNPEIPRLHLSRARLAYRAGDLVRAADVWDRVLELHPHAATWVDDQHAFTLLFQQGLPNRADGPAAVVQRDALSAARTALAEGDAGLASTRAWDALTLDKQRAALADRALYRDAPRWTGEAAVILARAAAQTGEWQTAAEALAMAEPYLTELDRRALEHVEIRVGLGLDLPWRGRTQQPSNADRLHLGFEAMRAGDAVAALDAWAPLLPALDGAWAPNVPVNDLAELALTTGAPGLAAEALSRARAAGVLDGNGAALLRQAAEALRDRMPTQYWSGPVRRYAVRRFQPHLASTADYVWVATSDGVLRVDREERTTHLQHVARGLPPGAITALAAHGDTVWLATTDGLFRGADDNWTPVEADDGLPLPHVTALATDGATTVIGTDAGLYLARADERAHAVHDIPTGVVQAIEMRGPDIACAIDGAGIFVRRHDGWAPVPGAPTAGVRTVALDSDGAAAFTTQSAEGRIVCRETPFGPDCAPDPAANTVGPVRGGNDRWRAENSAIMHWDNVRREWQTVDTLPDHEIPIALDAGAGRLWIVTPYAVYALIDDAPEVFVRYRPQGLWSHLIPAPDAGAWKLTGRTIDPPAGVGGPQILPLRGTAATGALVVDETGAPWVVAGRRLYRGHDVWQAVADLPEEAGALRLWLVRRDVVWAGDEHQVWSWSGTDGWRAHAPPDGVLSTPPRVRGIAATDDGRIWVAWTNRVSVWDGTAWTEPASAPRYTINAIAASSADVWIGTAHGGVYRLGDAPQRWTWNDGLGSNRVTGIAVTQGRVWATLAEGGLAVWDGTAWARQHVGNLRTPLAVDEIVALQDGTLWLRVGDTWYEQAPADTGDVAENAPAHAAALPQNGVTARSDSSSYN